MTEAHAERAGQPVPATTGTVAETVLLLREAATSIRYNALSAGSPCQPLWHPLASFLDAAADREQVRADACAADGVPLGEPEPGDEVHAAVALARAWMEGG